MDSPSSRRSSGSLYDRMNAITLEPGWVPASPVYAPASPVYTPTSLQRNLVHEINKSIGDYDSDDYDFDDYDDHDDSKIPPPPSPPDFLKPKSYKFKHKSQIPRRSNKKEKIYIVDKKKKSRKKKKSMHKIYQR